MVPPGLMTTSTVARPVSGLRRRFWPVLETTRMRSTVGLKSNPNSVPPSAGVNGPRMRLAAPVTGLMA